MKKVRVPIVGEPLQYAHDADAGCDLVAREEVIVSPFGGTAAVPTGVYLNVPAGYEAQVRPRSGIALRNSVTVLNTPGTVDAGYTGEVRVILINHGTEDFHVEAGDKIAQLVVNEVVRAVFVRVESHDDTERAGGGFGSTGVKTGADGFTRIVFPTLPRTEEN